MMSVVTPSLQVMGLEAARGAAQSLAALQGAPAPVAGGASEAVSAALGSLTRAELFEIMGQMKGLVVQNPGQARIPPCLKPCFRCVALLVMC